jgi:hypothetical protein
MYSEAKFQLTGNDAVEANSTVVTPAQFSVSVVKVFPTTFRIAE